MRHTYVFTKLATQLRNQKISLAGILVLLNREGDIYRIINNKKTNYLT